MEESLGYLALINQLVSISDKSKKLNYVFWLYLIKLPNLFIIIIGVKNIWD